MIWREAFEMKALPKERRRRRRSDAPEAAGSQAARLQRICDRIEAWFAVHQRALPWRGTYDPYNVWVSEVMLQQTRMEVVLSGYYDRFLSRFPTIGALASAGEQDVLAAWSGLGYYRRARMLRAGAIAVRDRFDGVLPRRVEDLMSIPGIGRYTAGAIASIAYGDRAPIVDGNVTRIVARLEGIGAPLGSPALARAAWTTAGQLVMASRSPRDLNQGLMEIGALVCRAGQPLCLLCPLQAECKALQSGQANGLPRKGDKKETVALRIPLYVISDGRGRIMMRRETGPLMNAMLHLPHGDSSILEGPPLAAVSTRFVGAFRHTITNRRISFEVHEAELIASLRDSPGKWAWIDPADLEQLPHPSYVKKALRLAGITVSS